ncbi:MAG: hypothetical protein Q6361_09075 [Candidatus Hermodarchaeota archaeon]|nr:hypothetical protein [Candidatus Hermodarchaeota archaeon]
MSQLYSLYVVYRDGRTLLQRDFQIENMEPDLVTGFLSAVSMFLSDLIGRICEAGQQIRTLEREDGRLRVIDREDVKILLEYGKNIYVAVFSTDDLNATRERMRRLVAIIEREHGELLENWMGDLAPFRGIVPMIDTLFRPFAIAERYVPFRVHTVPESSVPQELHPLLAKIDGQNSVESLASILQQPIFQVLLAVQKLQEQGAVTLKRMVSIEQLVSFSSSLH